MWMNEWEIERAAANFAEHPVAGPATLTLLGLVSWTNRNSDGWPYWQAPSKAAAKLQGLIQAHERWVRSEYQRPRDGAEATPEALKAALRPLKAFRTKRAADFPILATVADVEALQQRIAQQREQAERAELARLQAKYEGSN